jgi:hypothetical protein
MRRGVKVKSLSTRAPLRKTATTASAVSRRAFPAWIADDENGDVAFPARASVIPRVRDALVLRVVSKKKSSSAKGSSDARSTR